MVSWDRLADATKPQAASGTLSIVTLGHVHAEDLTALTPHFAKVEQLVLDIPPRNDLAQHRAELNRAVDAASGDWVLIVREREIVDEALANEIASAIPVGAARGFRIRALAIYSGKALRLGADDGGELRLFHRRYFLRRGEIGVQGTVMRLKNILRAMSFDSPVAHRDQLAKSGVPHSGLRHVLLFIRYALGARTFDTNTLRYLWIEAGFDQR